MTVAPSPRWTDRLLVIAFAPLHWVERARGRKRLALLALYAMVISIAAFFAWWGQSLRGLPDIGDPFDVAAFRSRTVADRDNAYPLYLQASKRLEPQKNKTFAAINKAINSLSVRSWSTVPPEAREALETSREALNLWKQATDRPDLKINQPAETLTQDTYDAIDRARITFPYLAIVEASRLQDQGDMAGAWSWYRAILKAQTHIVSSDLRGWRRGLHPIIPAAITQWAADPRVGPDLLRTALDEAQAIDDRMPSFQRSLQAIYLHNLAELEMDQINQLQYVRTEDEWFKYMPGYARGLMFLKREPERSRRILRLFYANLMAHADEPAPQQPNRVPPGVFDLPVDPSGKDPSRRISPQDLDKQVAASLLPNYLLDGRGTIALINSEKAVRATILIELASQLYEREHGSPPPVFNDLVGPYLKSLPAGAIGTEGPGTP